MPVFESIAERNPTLGPTPLIADTGTAPRRSLRPSPLFLLVVLALLMRLALLVAAHGLDFAETRGRDDSSFFNEATNIAAALVSGHGFSSPMVAIIEGDAWTGPTSWVAPVYPFLCAAVFKLLGTYTRQSFLIILLVQCVFSALTVIPIVRIGQRTVGWKAAYLAAVLWAVFPWFSKWPITWVWEISLSALLFTWLFWYALRLESDASSRMWAGFGVLWGFSLLVNPALMTLLVPSAAWVIKQRASRGRPWLPAATLAAAICVLVISPWLVRNRVVFGQWEFIRSNFGFEFALGNFPGSTGRGAHEDHPSGSFKEFAAYRSMGEPAYVRGKTQRALQFVRESPREFLWLTAKRVLWFWDGSAMRYRDPTPRLWLPWTFAAFSALLLPSLLLTCLRRVHGWTMFLGAMLLYPIPYYLTFSQVRYRHVLEPLMLLLLASAAMQFWTRIRSRAGAASA